MVPMKALNQVLNTVTPQVREGRLQSGQQSTAARPVAREVYIDAINQVFAEFELAYHNQYHKAFAQEGSETLARKYWLECLQEFPPEVILRAVRKVVKTQQFLPTVAAVATACENAHELFGLPSVQAAYVEACSKPQPKADQQWSHPAVFLAGQATGWFELANSTQAEIIEVFTFNYSELCRRVVHGELLDMPLHKALPAQVSAPLPPEENSKRLKALREKFDL
jgi:hypothetical protein